jgi:hypothetical protein
MTRAEAIAILRDTPIDIRSTREDDILSLYVTAHNMAIEALSKPNYESDTEVRLAVTDRNKDKVVLWDAFGEVEYYPNGEINCVHCPHYHETEDETGVHSHCGSHGRLIDADALLEAVNRIGLTFDGGVDINDLEGTIQEMADANMRGADE